MKKKLILSGLISFLICSGCGKFKENLPLPETKKPPQNSSPTVTVLPSPTVSASSTTTIQPTSTLTPTPTSTSTPSPSMTIRSDDSSSPLNPSISYLEISPEFGLTIYISQDIAWQQIVLYRDHTYYNYYWHYNLAYGDPIVFFLDRSSEEKGIVICFPTEELKEPLSPIGAREICGEAHMLDYENLAYEIPQVEDSFSSTIAFSQNASGENLFSLFNVDGEAYMEFPGLNAEEFGLSKQKLYPLRFDSLHYTDTGMCYQRVGIKEEEKMVWIGKFCWYTLFADETIGYRINNKRGFADGPYEKEWQLRPLEPDALLDLDGDGTAEKICSRFVI